MIFLNGDDGIIGIAGNPIFNEFADLLRSQTPAGQLRDEIIQTAFFDPNPASQCSRKFCGSGIIQDIQQGCLSNYLI